MCLSFLEYEISNVMIYYNFHTKTIPKYEIAKHKLVSISGKIWRHFFVKIVSFDVHIQKTWFWIMINWNSSHNEMNN
jgi:hypothetical protein